MTRPTPRSIISLFSPSPSFSHPPRKKDGSHVILFSYRLPPFPESPPREFSFSSLERNDFLRLSFFFNSIFLGRLPSFFLLDEDVFFQPRRLQTVFLFSPGLSPFFYCRGPAAAGLFLRADVPPTASHDRLRPECRSVLTHSLQ